MASHHTPHPIDPDDGSEHGPDRPGRADAPGPGPEQAPGHELEHERDRSREPDLEQEHDTAQSDASDGGRTARARDDGPAAPSPLPGPDPGTHRGSRSVPAPDTPVEGLTGRAQGGPISGSTDSGTPGTGPPAEPSSERISLSSPNDVVATMPYLVGEPPVPGLVVLTLCGRSVRSVLCRDLGQAEAADPLACAGPPVDSAVTEGADAVIVVGYGTAAQVSGHVGGLVTTAGRRGLKVLEAFRVHGGRYWSQVCVRPGCCPPEGTELDPDRSTGPAEAVLRGLAPRPPLRTVMDGIARARRTLDPPGSLRAETVRAALMDAESEAERLRRSGERVLRRCGAAVVRSAVEAERTGAGPHGVEELIRLAVFLRERPVRDTVWATITPETARTHLDLWSRVTRASLPARGSGAGEHAPWADTVDRADQGPAAEPGRRAHTGHPEHGASTAQGASAEDAGHAGHMAARADRAAPAALAAVAAWQLEDLVLARAALEVSLEADPQYSMALLMQQALDVGLPAERWIDHLHDRSG